MPYTRRQFVKTVSAGSMVATLGHPALYSQVSTARKPNIVFIMVDDLGFGDLSSYGAEDMQTPNIDALMRAGMRFSNAYANCPVCSPTRASLLTGRYPDLAGVPGVIRTHANNNWGYLSGSAVLLPELLTKAGYHTACVGKWHLGLESPNTPTERGFDFFHGFLGDMMDDYYHHRRHDNNYMRLNEEVIDPEGHATDLFSDWSVDYIKERGTNPDQPFFLYLAYNAPHTPIQPPDSWFENVKARENNIDDKRAKLVALIEHMDDGIGRVVTALKESGAYENTLIVFTSDNGGQLNVGANNGPLRSGKQSMFEGGIKVPACAVWPGKIAEGSSSTVDSMTMDWYPTLCEAGGAQVKHTIDGRSILPQLLGKQTEQEARYLFWVRREGGRYGGRAYYAVRYQNWKLLQDNPFEPYQLYDLANDPGEQAPVSDEHPMFNKLRDKLRDHIIAAGAVPWQKPL